MKCVQKKRIRLKIQVFLPPQSQEGLIEDLSPDIENVK